MDLYKGREVLREKDIHVGDELTRQDDRDNRLYDLQTMVDTHITIRVNCALKSRTKERK